jgi:hypothetical protein
MWRNEDGRPKSSGGSSSGWSELDLAALEAQVFLIGKWKNFEELEDSLSMPELVQLLKGISKKEDEDRKFQASLQGINLGEDATVEEESEHPTFEEIQMRAQGINGLQNDIIGLRGQAAATKGFGINQGLGYTEE